MMLSVAKKKKNLNVWNPDSTLWIYGHFSPLSRCIYVIGLETSRLPLLRIFATYINLLIEKS